MIYKTNSEEYELNTMVIDLNGTLVVGGNIHRDTIEHLNLLYTMGWTLYLLTGNQRGDAHRYEEYGLKVVTVKNSQEKEIFIKTLNMESCVAIGNARIDIGMFTNAKISIATLQAEGIHAAIIPHVDIIVPNIVDAFRLFADKDRFAATMKI